MQKMIINLSVALFIISCGQATGQVIINKSNKTQLAVKELSDDIKKASEKTDRFILLQNIRDSLSITRELPDSAKRKYSVKLKNKIEVYGFYDYATGADVQNDKLGYLNTFIYNSLFIQSKTGEIIDINGWKDADIITAAQNDGCDVGVTFAFKESNEAAIFLQNNSSQFTFIRQAIELMKFRSGKAINISFKNIHPEIKYNFYLFSKRLYDTLKKIDTSYKLLVTIPATTTGNYPIKELTNVSDRIVIDFSKNYSLKASPLASFTGTKTTLSYFINSGLPKEKIVVCLPYKGVIWEIEKSGKSHFIDYIKYKALRETYRFSGYKNYYLGRSYVVLEKLTVVKPNRLLRRIYYDDVYTISKKYEFIKEYKFAGVAVNGLGDDFGYTGLWDEMSYAFAEPDTVYTDSTKQIKELRINSSFAQGYNGFAICYDDGKIDVSKAIQNYSKAVDLDPQSAINVYNRGTRLYDNGFKDKALSDFRKADSLGKTEAKSYLKIITDAVLSPLSSLSKNEFLTIIQ